MPLGAQLGLLRVDVTWLAARSKTTRPRTGRVRVVLSRFGSRSIWQTSSRNSLSRHKSTGNQVSHVPWLNIL